MYGIHGGVIFVLPVVTERSDDGPYDQYKSYLPADELRQSSDDLTRLGRTYVTTGDVRYEKQCFDIYVALEARTGNAVRTTEEQSMVGCLVAIVGIVIMILIGGVTLWVVRSRLLRALLVLKSSMVSLSDNDLEVKIPKPTEPTKSAKWPNLSSFSRTT